MKLSYFRDISFLQAIKALFNELNVPVNYVADEPTSAKEILKDENYEIVDAEENPNLAKAYGIMQAPTLVVVGEGMTNKYVNISNIKNYVDTKWKGIL